MMYQVQVINVCRTMFGQVMCRICSRHSSNFQFAEINSNKQLLNSCYTFCAFSTSNSANIEVNLKSDVDYACSVLGVDTDCSINELRDAYIGLAKKYHPDGGTATADAKKFSQVKEAYKSILEIKKGKNKIIEYEMEDPDKHIYDIRHTAPQHRQYLNNEGIGFGTPSQREKQYNQYKVWQAASNIQEHRIQRLSEQTESALVIQERKHTKRGKISNAIERVVEDLIQESMGKGDFDNLSGSGKPLAYVDRNPHIDSATHNLNKILINNGFTPEWITLQSDIRRDIREAREKLSVLRSKMEDEPSNEIKIKWKLQITKYKTTIRDVNERIDKYNMIVPFMDKQYAHFNAEKDILNISNNFERYLPRKQEDIERIFNSNYITTEQMFSSTDNCNKVKWRDVWKDMKSVFKS